MATRVVLLVTVLLFCSCSWFGSRPHPPVPAEQQATLVLLPARLDTAVWESQEFAVYIWKRLNQIPEAERKKKEAQLYLNLKLAMEELAGSLLDEGLTIPALQDRRRPLLPPESY